MICSLTCSHTWRINVEPQKFTKRFIVPQLTQKSWPPHSSGQISTLRAKSRSGRSAFVKRWLAYILLFEDKLIAALDSIIGFRPLSIGKMTDGSCTLKVFWSRCNAALRRIKPGEINRRQWDSVRYTNDTAEEVICPMEYIYLPVLTPHPWGHRPPETAGSATAREFKYEQILWSVCQISRSAQLAGDFSSWIWSAKINTRNVPLSKSLKNAGARGGWNLSAVSQVVKGKRVALMTLLYVGQSSTSSFWKKRGFWKPRSHW